MKHCPRAVSIARPSTLQLTALPSELAAAPETLLTPEWKKINKTCEKDLSGFKFHAFKSNRMANTHHKKYKKSKGQSYTHNPVDRTLNKTLYQGLQCLHHIGNTQPADSTFGRTLRKKRAELTRFIQPANDEW